MSDTDAALPHDDIETVAATERPEASKDRQFVTALARGLEVLRAFRAHDDLLGNQEIAQRTGLPNSPLAPKLAPTGFRWAE